nr:reverse transcriptase domain-containing protein [Tanacetum cinerariifolium]
MDRYLGEIGIERRRETQELYELKQSVSTLEDQMRGLMLEDKEEKERLKKKIKVSQKEKEQMGQAFRHVVNWICKHYRVKISPLTTLGLKVANGKSWGDIKKMMMEEFCPDEEVKRKLGHYARDCKKKAVATGANTQSTLVCYGCGEKGHTRNYYPNKNNPQGEEARGRAYVIKEADKNQGPNVVMGTFLFNNHYATVLFDSGSDKSFMNTSFSHLIDIDPVRLDTSYEVELADERVASTNIVLKGCTINIVNHLFKIDLMPIELGTLNIIIGMDWLVEQDSVIMCGKKVVNVPYKNKTLVVEGDRGASRLKVISCIKARKYIERGSQLFVAHVTEREPKKKRLEDVPVIRDFLEVFCNDLSRLPPPRQVEF